MKNREFLKEAVAHRLGVGVQNVNLLEITKNNGVKHIAVTVTGVIEGSNVLPCVSIDDVVKEWDCEGGESTSWAASEIAGRYLHAVDQLPYIGNLHMDKQYILDRAYVRVIGAEKNRDVLAAGPHRLIADLAAVCRVRVSAADSPDMSSFLVDNRVMEKYDIDEDDLFRAAMKNTQKEKKFTCVGVKQLLRETFCIGEDDDTEECLYVVRPATGVLEGAAVLAFPELIKQFVADVCPAESKAYILPSSIHEILIHVGNDATVDELKQMVMSVNRSQVATEEVLSDSVYELDADSMELRVIA